MAQRRKPYATASLRHSVTAWCTPLKKVEWFLL